MDESAEIEPPESPEWFKTILWLWHQAKQHVGLLMRPPVIVALIIAATSGFMLAKHESSESAQIAIDRVAFLNDQILAYKDRLNGDTPDQAAKRIQILEARVASDDKKLQMLFPDVSRSLDEEQKKVFRDNADQLRKDIKILQIFAWNQGDSAFYGLDFLKVFQEQNIQAIGPIMTVCSNKDHGVLIGLLNIDKPSDEAKDFFRILGLAKLDPHFTRWSMGQQQQPQDFDLFICP